MRSAEHTIKLDHTQLMRCKITAFLQKYTLYIHHASFYIIDSHKLTT
jgi:hypothetical protein